ncbi:hypothetical protein [Streptomyces sp. SID12501]|uniref:Uncharacterized protein n=1 Tax=Streptomyces sp. SID12501 TaxID=2706042 RepID=A0A6B3C1W5_9ACTN|nr:hypothetical protein [Streptomyces sp. SID12501]NEC90456.1 hypothetical protein [Streptomyces sp. SID12501]
MSEQTLPEPVRDLLAAIVEALTVPLADQAADDDTANRLMRERASNARIIANSALTSPSLSDIARAAGQLCGWTADSPVTYRPYQARTPQTVTLPTGEDQ